MVEFTCTHFSKIKKIKKSYLKENKKTKNK